MRLERSLSVAAMTAACLVVSSVSHAQSVSSSPKGVVGGTLLGAETVLLTEAAFDVHPTWLYYVGGGVGAIGGGVAGYYIEDSISAKSNMYLMSAGMLLMIPTAVAALSAAAYEPPEDYTQDQAPSDEPLAEPAMVTTEAAPAETPAPASPSPGSSEQAAPSEPGAAPPPAPAAPQSRRQRRHNRRVHGAPAVIAFDQDRFHLEVPAVAIQEAYSPLEIAKYGVRQHAELRVPVLRVAF